MCACVFFFLQEVFILFLLLFFFFALSCVFSGRKNSIVAFLFIPTVSACKRGMLERLRRSNIRVFHRVHNSKLLHCSPTPLVLNWYCTWLSMMAQLSWARFPLM